MKKSSKSIISSPHLLITLIVTIIVSGVIGSISLINLDANLHTDNDRYIVVFKDNFRDPIKKSRAIRDSGGISLKKLDIINGTSIEISGSDKKKLINNAGVLRIDKDDIVSINKKGGNSKGERGNNVTTEGQEVPWGITAVRADKTWNLSSADSSKIAILDTGIDMTHPDLIGNIGGFYNALNPKKSAKDDNGHGTHVAGIVGAMNNEIGVVGVAPKARLYAVKVLDRHGNGYVSDVIKGLEFAKINNLDVVNMSLSTSTDNQSLHTAIKEVYDSGISLVAASGNDSSFVSFPAKYPEVIAVSAIDESLMLAPFSNAGPEIDITAPGVHIKSTYKGGSYKTLDGTSMACPHVTGAIGALISTQVGSNDLNSNGTWDPIELKNVLKSSAKDIGELGNDEKFGAGLLDVLNLLSI